MVFSSTVFLWGFLPITVLLYFVAGKRFRNHVLLAASLFFYAWGEPWFVLVMLFSIILNWHAALTIRRKLNSRKRKVFFIVALLMNLGILFIFKYLNFSILNINRLFGRELVPQTNIRLPIGISFFTFQSLSYLIDVYHEKVEPQDRLLNVALYISLFPQLIAGPIVRYNVVAAELAERNTSLTDVADGVSRFFIGLGKKAILANTLAILAETFFGRVNTSELTAVGAWLGALSYTFQIYFDFSGYSDMAIGLGRIFGFHFEENFNYPYVSKSVSEFWRRWHISLGVWFRDYVYIPLGGSRKGKICTYRNLLIVWMLTGIWHGANWTFVFWGLLHGVIIMGEKWGEKARQKVPVFFQYLCTMLIVVIGWVLFRCDGIKDALWYIRTMFTIRPITTTDCFELSKYLPIIVFAAICSMPIGRILQKNLRQTKAGNTAELILKALSVTVIAIIAVACVISSTYNPFIYFNF